ncbi:hypothetical protein Y1Q_0001233 [Alligator mississippiensis]|uniref:Uncharacterized protein n=1 Tax=Alligator mississippiensis TaxID=8496 RepID=A0A151PEI1_ALLMI|nr:hypothetical protein Y1Q_0001233 [Alligator mississippiensis]
MLHTLLLVVTCFRTLTREVVFYGHLTKQKRAPTACFDQFIFCFQYASWKAMNLLTNKRSGSTVEDCIKMGLSEVYWYYRKTEEGDGKELVGLIWKRWDWHRFFRGKASKENNKEDNSKDSDNDDNRYDNDA